MNLTRCVVATESKGRTEYHFIETAYGEVEECTRVSPCLTDVFGRNGCTDHLPMHRGYRIVAKAGGVL